MTVASDEGHAFISYVREDASSVDRLQAILEAAGVRVWRDTADLWPGEDWRGRIRQAVTKNALVFIVCFSKNSEARTTSGQNEELMLAVDQLRLRRPDQPWLVPVRFDEVEVPDLDVGGGRTLNSIQRADLIGDGWDLGAARLVAAVLRILDRQPPANTLPTPTAPLSDQLKAALRDPAGDIALDDALMPIAEDARQAMADQTRFPENSDVLGGPVVEAAFYVVDLVDEYMAILNTALDALVITAQWSRPEQLATLTRFVDRLAPTAAGGAGMVVLTSLRWFPSLPVLYAGTVAALIRGNYGAIKAIAIDATVRDRDDGRLSLISRGHAWRPFSRFELVPQILAFREGGEDVSREVAESLRAKTKGNRYTPVSDYLHDVLRPKFTREVPDDDDYSDLFDRAEVLLGALAVDAEMNKASDRTYVDGPHFGRFTWRNRYVGEGDRIESRLLAELRSEETAWAPVAAGLFGGSVDRARAALESFVDQAAEARNRRW